MLVHEALARALRAEGIDTMFGVIGDANLFMADSYVRAAGGRYVAATSEANAVLMAMGYASVGARLGVVTVTHGPAVTNTLTALVEAVRQRLPMVLLCGDTAPHDVDHLQNIPQLQLLAPTGAGLEDATTPEGVLAGLTHAVRRAWTERRPIVVNIPAQLQWMDVDDPHKRPTPVTRQASHPDPEALDTAVGVIGAARRPVILAGYGAVESDAAPALLALAERLDAIVATTLRAKDLFRGEPRNAGIFGTFGEPAGTAAIEESDCVVAFGASLNKYTTAHGALLRDKSLIQCDVDPTRLGMFYDATATVLGDATTVATTIREWVDQAGIEPTGFGRKQIARWQGPDTNPESEPAVDGQLDLQTVLRHVDRAMPAARVMITDGGRFVGQTLKLLHVAHPSLLNYTFRGFGSIGLGVGTAIGAAIAAPDRPTMLIVGDGGLMLGGFIELSTAVREGVDLTVIVINDGGYGAEHIQFQARDKDPAIAHFDWPDFAGVATSLGASALTVDSVDQLAAIDTAIAERAGVLLIDVKLDPDAFPPVDY